MEVDEAVENGDDVINAEYERIENASAAELQTAVHVVQLRQGEEDQPEQNDPRLPAVELIVPVDNCPNEQFDGALGDQERVRREDTADAAEEHSADKAEARRGARIEALQEPVGAEEEHHQDAGADHPDDELSAPEQLQQLVEVVRRLGNGTERAYEDGAGCD